MNNSANHSVNQITESKKNHVWRKIVWVTDPDQFPLGPHHSVEVYCSEEANGYAIWYVRKLGNEDNIGVKGFSNGDYLLSYHAKGARDVAIERAVLIANQGNTPAEIVANLDRLAAGAQKV